MSIYIIFSRENIMGGGPDTAIRGVYLTIEEAKKCAQDCADRSTFQDWLDLEKNHISLYRTGWREIPYLVTLEIMKVPLGTEINQEMDSIDSVTASYDNPLIRTHQKFDEYKKHFDICANKYKK